MIVDQQSLKMVMQVSELNWDKLEIEKERKRKVLSLKCVIKNGITGAFVCNSNGRKKVFYNKTEAEAFLNYRKLTDVYEIEYV